jgi:hypothetical protein
MGDADLFILFSQQLFPTSLEDAFLQGTYFPYLIGSKEILSPFDLPFLPKPQPIPHGMGSFLWLPTFRIPSFLVQFFSSALILPAVFSVGVLEPGCLVEKNRGIKKEDFTVV